MSDINYSELEMRVSQLAIEVQALKEHFKEINLSDIYTLSDSINDIKKELIDFKYNINTLQSNYSSVSQEIYSQEKELKKWAQKEFLSKSSLTDVDFNTFVTDSELISKNYLTAGIAKDTYLTKIDFSNQLKNYLKSTDLKNYVTESALKTKLSSYLSVSDAKNTYVHKDTISTYLTPYSTKKELYEDYFTKSEIQGKYALKTDIPKLTSYVKKTDLDTYVHKDTISSYLIPYSTKKELYENYFTKSEIQGRYALKTDIPKLTSYVKRTELDNYVNNETIKRYTTFDNVYTIVDDNNTKFYTKKYITDNFYTKTQSNNIFLTKSDAKNTYVHKDTISTYLTPYSTKNELYENYLTKSEIQGKYALKTDIPRLTSYVKRTELDNYVTNETIKRYTTFDNVYTILDNNNTQFYTKKYITDNFYTKIQSNNIFLTKSDAKNTYITAVDAGKIFLKIEDYRGLKDAMILNTSYEDRYDDFVKDLKNQQLKLGWYIVDDRAVLVNNNKVYSFRDPFAYTKSESDAKFAKLEDFKQNIALQNIAFKGKYNLNVINERLCYENDFVVVGKNLNDYVQNHWIEDDELGL